LIGHHDFNHDPSHEGWLCDSLPASIPVGKSRPPDISNQDTCATIDLSQQSQHTLIIMTAVVTDTIQENDRGSRGNHHCEWLRHGE
jgi:hypothetical protein